MKRAAIFLLMSMMVVSFAQAQNKIDDARMERDIEVAENVLGTLLRQQMGKKSFFPFEVAGSYTPGYGVTFRLPADGPMVYFIGSDNGNNYNYNKTGSYSYSYNVSTPKPKIHVAGGGDGAVIITAPEADAMAQSDDCENCPKTKHKDEKLFKKSMKRTDGNDSAVNAANDKMIAASKDFIADYGDMITQLSPEEKILITNRADGGSRPWFAGGKQRLISLEITRGDITQYKQGKLTRAQLVSKINVVNTETTDEVDPDLELLSSIFNRLYRPDLSKSYYVQENMYYERLKDFGVIYYMQVYSSNESDFNKFSLPTVDMDDVDKATRDKKVTEMYPVFEKDIKESMIDYGRTLKSLKDNEQLIFNIKLTKCSQCGIPSTLELSIKSSVLKEFNSGKLTKEAAVAQIAVKKGTPQ